MGDVITVPTPLTAATRLVQRAFQPDCLRPTARERRIDSLVRTWSRQMQWPVGLALENKHVARSCHQFVGLRW